MMLKPRVDPANVAASLGELSNRFGSIGGGAGLPVEELRDRYLQAVESAEFALRLLAPPVEWLGQLHSERYWRIRDLVSNSARPSTLVSDEAALQKQWLDQQIADLELEQRWQEGADLSATRAFLDTNIYCHFRPFDQIDWPAELRVPAVRIVVPFITLRELDNVKNNRRGAAGDRAASRLRAMHRYLSQVERGPVAVRAGVTLEVPLAARRRRPSENNDEDFLDEVERLSGYPGGPVAVVTGDLSMDVRAARARGLRVVQLRDELRLDPRRGAFGAVEDQQPDVT